MTPPLLVMIYHSTAAEFEAVRIKAASGAPGCLAARRRMTDLRSAMLRLEAALGRRRP